MAVGLSVAVGIFAGSNAAAATTYTVTTLADTAGSCSGASCTTVRAAITVADGSAGNTIDLTGLSGTITLTSALPTIVQSMVFLGPGASALTISGGNAYQILNISSSSATVVISGLMFANANSANGGAIDNGGSLTVSNCTFSNNTAPQGIGGGALYNGGTLTVNGSTFANNSAQLYGGALFSATFGNIVVNNSTFFGNSANQGGAIYSEGAMTLTNSTFSGNSAADGGAILNGSGASKVSNSLLTGDIGEECSGVGCGVQGPYLLVSGTEQQINGAWDSGAITISWTDSLGNYYSETRTCGQYMTAAGLASGFGGAISNDYAGIGKASAKGFGPLIEFWLLNGATFGPFTITNSSHSFTLTPVSENILASGNIVGTAANLSSLGSYGGQTQTMIPLPGSPAICGGTVSGLASGVTTDQRGFSRTTTYNGITCVDVGAVQTDYTAVAFSSSSYTGAVNQVPSPAPVVTVTENGQNLGGVPITLGYSGTGSPTGLGPVTTVGGTGAIFSSLTASAAAQGTLSISLPITASSNVVQPAALTASASLNIQTSLPQTITFVTSSPVTYGYAPITLMATGGRSGNPVTFSLDTSSTPGAATVSGSTLTIKGVGTVVIDANQAAGSGYDAAVQVQQSVVVNPASLTITASSPTVTYGSAAPTITPIFGTFFNGDTSAVLTKQPTCVTAYTTTSAVGSSPSTSCSGAAATNYAFTYVNGAVSVNPAPTFTISGSSASLIITPGATTGNTVSIITTPFNGFTGTVNLSCSIGPTAVSNTPTCSLSPASVTITGTGTQTSTLTISTTAATTAENHLKKLLWPSAGTTLALVLMIGVPRRRRGWLTMLGVLVFSIAVGAIGCGVVANGVSSGTTGTVANTYTITVTGTSGNVTGTGGTIALTVQ